jgi:hypothetical protein
MKNEPAAPPQPLEPTFDRTPQPFGSGPPDPIVCDASARPLRQRTVNFAAKRMVDMLYVSGLDRETADRHFCWRPAAAPGDLVSRPTAADPAPLIAAHRAGDITIEADDADRRVKVVWNDPGFGEPVLGAAIARPGYGGILLGERPAPLFDPQPIARQLPDAERPWPVGAAVETPPPAPAGLADALDNLFTSSAGAYGILIATRTGSCASATVPLACPPARRRVGP